MYIYEAFALYQGRVSLREAFYVSRLGCSLEILIKMREKKHNIRAVKDFGILSDLD